MPRPVVVRLVVSHVLVRLEVEDDGNGFDPSSLPDSRLGLRIMAERMDQVDGDLWLGPRPGGGTLLVAEAPVRHTDFLTAPEGVPADETRAPITVLVVDDHALFRDGVCSLLQRWPEFQRRGVRRRRRGGRPAVPPSATRSSS